jgi:hypothetical protein
VVEVAGSAARTEVPAVRNPAGGLGSAARARLLGAAAFAGTVALVVSRRPDALTNPQFWAEDGAIWYAQAHKRGALRALLTPCSGYAQTFSRLTAALSLRFNLIDAPLIFALAAILAQSLAPLFLLSRRFARTIPDVRVRALAALLFIGLPNSFEIQSNVTNSQTHLALLALLIVLAEPPATVAWQVFDVFFVILAGLSGPTCVLLVPVAALTWWHRRGRWSQIIGAALLLPASLQAAIYLTTGASTRPTSPLGAGIVPLLELLGGQIFLGATVGAGAYSRVMRLGYPWAGVTTVLIGVAGIAFVARAALVTKSFTLRMFVLFACLALAAALLNPVVEAPPRWATLRLPGVGIRYWAPPMLAYLAATLWSACADPSARWRWLSRALLLIVLLVGMPLDWRVAPRVDLHFADEAARYAAAPRHTRVSIPIPPSGWSMTLRKRR